MEEVRNMKIYTLNLASKITKFLIRLIWLGFIALILFLTLCTIFEDKNAWPLVTIEIFIILIFSFEKIGKVFKILKIGKEGIELETITKQAQKTTEEAKETLDELKKLALIYSKNLSKLITRVGRWDSAFNMLELYQYRLDIENLLTNFGISENEIKQNTTEVDNFILLDLIFRISEQYNGSLVQHCQAIQGFRPKGILKIFETDINAIEKYLNDNNLMDEKNKNLLKDLKEFHQNRKLTDHAINYTEVKK